LDAQVFSVLEGRIGRMHEQEGDSQFEQAFFERNGMDGDGDVGRGPIGRK
jgi:hypothetical protein